MKVTYSWLKDFVDIRMKPQKLAEALTMAGLEVTSCKKIEDDWGFEIEATSNRPDWLSVIGVAREVAAITKSKLKIKIQKRAKRQHKKGKLTIKILDRSGCRQYMGTVIEGIKIAPSPKWMQKRLKAIGLRPINNVVDITNYVLYETAQPLHAFDLDRLSKTAKIIVRRAKSKEEIATLDGVKRILAEDILVVADSNRSIAIAGVIGGADTEVNSGTKNILLEAAEFNPIVVRKGARLLGVSTDSSYRFERKVDPCGIAYASQRAQELILKLAGGKIISSQIAKTKDIRHKIKITLRADKIEEILGINIAPAKIKQILSSLGLNVLGKTKGTGQMIISIPSYRQDVVVCEDLAEEIARIYGYERIPLTIPYILPRFINSRKLRYLQGEDLYSQPTQLIRNILVALGYCEVINYSLNPQNVTVKNKTEGLIRPAKIANPLSNEQEILRTGLFSGLVNNIAYNINRKSSSMRIFELGKIFSRAGNGGFTEDLALGFAAYGRLATNWQHKQESQITLFDLKGHLEEVLLQLGIKEREFSYAEAPLFIQGASFDIWTKGKKIGMIGEVAPCVLDNYSIKEKGVFLAQILLKDIIKEENLEKALSSYSVYPSIRRDISLLIKRETQYKNIVEIIYYLGKEMISDIKLLEQYTGKQVPEGFKNLLLSVEYGSYRRTLKDEDIDDVHGQILDKLVEKLGAKIR